MLEITAIDGSRYCIDATEVTKEQYGEFLDTNPAYVGPSPVCDDDFPATYVPAREWPYPPEKASHPVNYVSWCDAYAFCRFAGKRLCGKVGGGPNSENLLDPAIDEWIGACTGSGAHAFPYGDAYAVVCNTEEVGLEDTAPVGSFPKCEGGVPGLFDMMGNVWEWVDLGEEGCSTRGMAFFGLAQPPGCAQYGLATTHTQSLSPTGFRCCRDAE